MLKETKLTYDKYLKQYNNLDIYLRNKVDWLENSNYSTMTKNTYISTFISRIYPLETILKKDLYSFSQYEIEDIIKNISTISIKTSLSTFSIIKCYIQWATNIGMNIKGENPCNKIIVNDIIRLNKTAIKDLYMTRKEFYDYIYELEGSDVDKCIVMLLRYGLTMNELLDLKWGDIDEYNMIIYTKDIDYPIDELLIYCLNRCKKCEEYELINTKDDKQRIIKYRNDEYVCKQSTLSRRSSKMTLASLHTRIKTLFSNNGLQKLNVNAMRNMPIFDMMYSIYKENGKITKDDTYECIKIYSRNKSKESLWNKIIGIKQTFKIIFDVQVINK